MSLIHCEFFSEVLGLSTAMTVILPQSTPQQIGLSGRVRGEVHPTLYLLHGMSDAHTIWVRRTSLERYVAPLGLAVVMPSVHRSFYTDMAHGGNYWTFISEELPMLARSFFPLAPQREGKFVAGLSVGGYGTFKLALSYPERFSRRGQFVGGVGLGLAVQSPSGAGKIGRATAYLQCSPCGRRQRQRSVCVGARGDCLGVGLPAAIPVLRYRGHAPWQQCAGTDLFSVTGSRFNLCRRTRSA